MPKPVLSDSLFNADDVATAILDKAELSVTNQDFAVTDRSSKFDNDNVSGVDEKNAFSFNGFMFINFAGGNSSGMSNGDVIFQINDSDFYPTSNTSFPSISHQGDYAMKIVVKTNGLIEVIHPGNVTDATYYFAINGFYRFT